MPRPKNNELHEQMIREARKLFAEKGYAATSYADIAEACFFEKFLYGKECARRRYAVLLRVSEQRNLYV